MTLRVAYIPEHFSTPLFFAQKHGYYQEQGVTVVFVPVVEGTGRLIKLLEAHEVDVAIGLTEGFVADIANGNEAYKLVDTYVKSPLCWAISTGINRLDITSAAQLQGKRIGVSRIGSGSYIMSFVLGLQYEFSEPFFAGHPVRSNFKNLRDSVNSVSDDESTHSDAFMWEHFTSKKYYDTKEIKRIGEIYTPWPSWVVAVRSDVLNTGRDDIAGFIKGVNKGIAYFEAHPNEAIEHIYTTLDYTQEDAAEWLRTVTYNTNIGEVGLDWEVVVEKTARVLRKAGVLKDGENVINQRLTKGILSQPL